MLRISLHDEILIAVKFVYRKMEKFRVAKFPPVYPKIMRFNIHSF